MFSRTVTGLDIGSWSVKAVELRAGLRDATFLRLEETRLPADASPEEREATIQLFVEQRGLSTESLVTAFPTDRVTQRHLRFPFSGRRRVAQAIAFEVDGDLPIPMENVILAHEQVLARPEQTHVLAVIAPREELRRYLASMRRMELEPQIIEMEGAVLANLSTYFGLGDVPRLVLDIGHVKTNLCLLVDGKPVLLRRLPIAGHHFTEAVAERLGITYEAAEAHKHEEGIFEDGSTKPISTTVRDLLDRLARESLRSLQSAAGDPLDAIAPAEIVLTGGSARLPHLCVYFQQRTGLSCELLTLPAHARDAEVFAGYEPGAFAQAAALALRGSRTERVTSLDFRSEEFAYTPDLSGLRGQLQLCVALFALVLALWMLSLGANLFARQRQADGIRTRIAEVYRQAFPGAPETDDPVAAMQSALGESRDLADHLGVTAGGPSPLDVLEVISARIPESLDISLTELNLERRGVQARGHAKDFVSVDGVKAELQRYEWFEEVVISDVVTDPRTQGKTFNLTIRLREGL